MAASLLAAAPASAQHRLMLSNSADFSSMGHAFTDGETIYIKVQPGARLDAAAVTKSEFEVAPVGEGEEFEGTLSLHDDGSFTGSVEVSSLVGASTAWRLKVKIEDDFGHEFQARAAIAIRGRIAHRPDDDEEQDDGDEEQDDGDEEQDDGDEEEEDDENEERVRVVIRGVITAVGDDGTLTIGDASFLVTSDTEIRDGRGARLTIDDVEVGMVARAHLLVKSTGAMTAIRLKVEHRFEDEDVKVTGRIEAVSSTEITVHGTTFVVTEHTEIEGHGDEEISIADLQVGMIARVEGEREDGVLVASEIRVRGRIHHEGRLVGLVTATSDDALEVNGVSFAVTEATIVEGAASLAGVSVGQRVKVHFRLLADGTRLALRVRVQSDNDDEAEFTGVIDSIEGETIVVAGVTVHTTVATEIEDEEGNAITLADLEAGQTVEVKGVAILDGILATKIKVEESVVVSGSINSQSNSILSVAGRDFALHGETLIVGENNVQLSIAYLTAGAFVEVLAIGRSEVSAGKTQSTILTADRVLVMQSAGATGVEDGDALPKAITLRQNYPNPFNPSTTITFEIDQSAAGNVSLAVYNTLGQRVRTLVSGTLTPGQHSFEWNGRDDAGIALASGVYLYRLDVDGRSAVRSMTLLK